MIFTSREYEQYSLKEFAEWLHTGYYNDLAMFCSIAADKLSTADDSIIHEKMLAYIQACSRVLDTTHEYINNGKDRLVTYVKELHDKVTEGHNCAMCSSSCGVQHGAYIAELLETGSRINNLLQDVNTAAIPLRVNAAAHPLYTSLRNDLFMIDSILRKLFYIEETILIPRLLQAQKNINVRIG